MHFFFKIQLKFVSVVWWFGVNMLIVRVKMRVRIVLEKAHVEEKSLNFGHWRYIELSKIPHRPHFSPIQGRWCSPGSPVFSTTHGHYKTPLALYESNVNVYSLFFICLLVFAFRLSFFFDIRTEAEYQILTFIILF